MKEKGRDAQVLLFSSQVPRKKSGRTPSIQDIGRREGENLVRQKGIAPPRVRLPKQGERVFRCGIARRMALFISPGLN